MTQYILNRVPSKSVPRTPYELWAGAKPKLEYVRVQGCLVHVLLPLQERYKLQEKIKKFFSFAGHLSHSKGFRVYDHDNMIIMECRDVFFLEDPMVNPKVEPQRVELYEIFKSKWAQASGGFDEEDVGHRIPSQGPLQVIEQPDEPIGRPIRARKQLAYLDDYFSLLETA